jgi:transcriptional regulator with XRE-family HTH domain
MGILDMKDINEIVRNNILHFRLKKGLTQEALALMSGIHRAYIGFIERGHRPANLTHLQKISDALGINIKELFREQINED